MSSLYDEVLANLTWYQLNSEYNDPMYQYMVKLERELFRKIKLPLVSMNYSVQDDFVIHDRYQILRYGIYQCSVPSMEAYMDSWFSCFLFQLPFFLEKIQIGWIGFIFVLPIMLISIFGGINDSYRWFILHQAIWDAFLCYDFICARPTIVGWTTVNNYGKEDTCFYNNNINISSTNILFDIIKGFRIFIRNASFIPVFHLALSRFICMYFPRFYKSFTKNGYKILIFILIFNIFCIGIFVAASTSFAAPLLSILNGLAVKCDLLCPTGNTTTYCEQNIPEYFRCKNRVQLDLASTIKSQLTLGKILKYISFSIPPVMFLLSIICAGFLFYKIVSQLKFQLKTNPESFKQTIKISLVVGFQCLTMSLMFLTTGLQKFMQIRHNAADTLTIYDNLPIWLFLLQYYTTTASLNLIRIILDSCIFLQF